MKKKYVLSIIILDFFSLLFSYENKFKDYCNNKFITFSIRDKENEDYFASVWIENNQIFCNYGSEIIACLMSEYHIYEDYAEIYFFRTAFSNYKESNDEFKYRKWVFPLKYKVRITYEDLINSYEYKKKKILIDSSVTYPAECQAIVIDNLSIRESPSLTANKIGRYDKRTEITLYGKSEKEEEIDGIKSYWYKVKLNDDSYGWVFGGYVRIFFEDDSLGYSDKELILKYIE